MTGPQHHAAAEAALAHAESYVITSNDPADMFERQMRLFDAHLAVARLGLDVAQAEAAGSLADVSEIHSEETQARTNTLFANRNAWIAAITGTDGAS